MLHHMKQHLTPEVARAHFCAGKGSIIMGLSRWARKSLEKRRDMPIIEEDVLKCIDDFNYNMDDASTPPSFTFEKHGMILESNVFSGDYASSTKFGNVYVGQKFYVASWPGTGNRELFYAQDYWRLEELTPREQAVAEEVERLAVEDFVRSVNMDKARRITARYSAPADKKRPEFQSVCHRYIVTGETYQTVTAKIAAECFDKSHSAALEYLVRERDPETRERYKNLLSRDELEVYNNTADWLERTIKKHLNDVVDSSAARDIADKYDADRRTKRVTKGLLSVKTVAEGLAARYFKKCMNALMEYVIVYLDVETNERFADQLTDGEYALYQEVKNKIRQGC